MPPAIRGLAGPVGARRARQGELYPSDHYPLVAVLDWQG